MKLCTIYKISVIILLLDYRVIDYWLYNDSMIIDYIYILFYDYLLLAITGYLVYYQGLSLSVLCHSLANNKTIIPWLSSFNVI